MALEFVNDIKKGKDFFKGLDYVSSRNSNVLSDKSEIKTKANIFWILLWISAFFIIAFYLSNYVFMLKYKTGDIVNLGQWPKDQEDISEPIEWIILDKKIDGTAIIASRYGIDARPYGEKRKTTWEYSLIRQWLNDDFYNSAFDENEKNSIMPVQVENADSDWEVPGGNDTRDSIFLLSFEQAWKYFESENDRRIKATSYAIMKGASVHGSGHTWWWLRTPGRSEYNAACVYSFGKIGDYGYGVEKKTGAVRPAIRVNLRKLPKR